MTTWHKEILAKTARMIEGLDIPTKIGVHGSNIHSFGHNPATIGLVEIFDKSDAMDAARMLRKA